MRDVRKAVVRTPLGDLNPDDFYEDHANPTTPIISSAENNLTSAMVETAKAEEITAERHITVPTADGDLEASNVALPTEVGSDATDFCIWESGSASGAELNTSAATKGENALVEVVLAADSETESNGVSTDSLML